MAFYSLIRTFASAMRKIKTIEMKRLTIEEYREAEKLPLIVVLDDVRSMYNIGSVFRTCDAFRVEAVYLCGICQTPPSTEIHKTALGAEESVAWKYFKTALEAVDEVKKQGYTVLSVEQVEHSTKLQTFEPQRGLKYAVVLGNEVKGVSSRRLGWLLRDTSIRHQTLNECQRYRWYYYL